MNTVIYTDGIHYYQIYIPQEMQITKKEETKKEFSPQEWAKFNNKRARELRRELKRIEELELVTKLPKNGFSYGHHYCDGRVLLYNQRELEDFLFRRNKLVLMEFPKTN